MRIGEVHALLREEFPAIELSKIRYYEDKGLVQPSRSRKGYRLYSSEDVACLREAFRLAQNEFVPLRVIRQRLIEQGLLADDGTSAQPRTAAQQTPATIVSLPVRREVTEADVQAHPSSSHAAPEPAPPMALVEPIRPSLVGARLSDAEFAAASRLTMTQVTDLIRYGLLSPCAESGARIYTEDDLEVAALARPLIARGVEARHLQSLRRTVDRELDLVRDVSSGQRTSGSSPQAETRAVADEIASLRATLRRRAVDELPHR
jgi:DNA-binding transcriptional MerR regulator